VNFSNDGLSLWYGTPDAPAPGDDGIVPRGGGTSLIVGVHPASPSNSIVVRYRVDGGAVRTVPGRELRTDYDRRAQYFAIAFPPIPTGEVVEFSVVLGCAGRQAPPPHVASRFPSRFRLGAEQRPAARATRPARAAASQPRFDANLRFVLAVTLNFESPQFIGETAAGVRVNFFVRDGTAVGDGVAGRVLDGTSDHLVVRRDGIGVIHILGAIAMDDGGVLDIASSGYVDLGADGYRLALARNLPDRLPLVINPLLSTRHPRYRWLSRVQCVGVGQTHLNAAQASYSIYAATPGAARDV
jgi:Protein of unknown function (DUF3237)